MCQPHLGPGRARCGAVVKVTFQDATGRVQKGFFGVPTPRRPLLGAAQRVQHRGTCLFRRSTRWHMFPLALRRLCSARAGRAGVALHRGTPLASRQ